MTTAKQLDDFLGNKNSDDEKELKAALSEEKPFTLTDFAAQGMEIFIKFTEANPILGVFLGYELEKDRFKPDRMQVQYHLEVDGKERLLTSQSRRLARALIAVKVKKGDKISIAKIGDGFNSTFKVDVLERFNKENHAEA